MLAFQQGGLDAYEEIYRLYSPRIRRVCARMLKNPQDVEEATQETFLKAYQALGRFNGRYQLGAWLARIASNVCLDQLRARSRGATQIALSDEHESAGTERGPEEIVVGANPRVQEAIADIQPLHAEALRLRALGGLSHREMAGQLAMTPAQVKALLHRARSSFRRAWDKAEGWALAPIVAIRSTLSNRSSAASGTSSNLIGFTPSMSPLLAERVAASAVIVAVALSGAPTQPDGAASARRTPKIAAETPDTARPIPPGGAVRFDEPHRHAVAAAPGPATGEDTDDPVTKVLEAVGEQRGRLQGPEKKDDDAGNEEPGLGNPGAAHTKPVMKKVREALSQLGQPD
ncbi:MAG: sigma-70 family RNA polymerase sigma factor [Actinomycetota bacterium]|nr:sigma-70 family RNA polymerase sigma factor [Actinomycetota bacterium]